MLIFKLCMLYLLIGLVIHITEVKAIEIWFRFTEMTHGTCRLTIKMEKFGLKHNFCLIFLHFSHVSPIENFIRKFWDHVFTEVERK